MTSARDHLIRLIDERGETLSDVSRAIGKNHSYLHQYIKYAKPRHLPEVIRHRIARHLEVDERTLRDADYSREISPSRHTTSTAAAATTTAEPATAFIARPNLSEQERLHIMFSLLSSYYQEQGIFRDPHDVRADAMTQLEQLKKSIRP